MLGHCCPTKSKFEIVYLNKADEVTQLNCYATALSRHESLRDNEREGA